MFCIFAIVKRLLHSISHLLLALLVLASTVSWKVDKHYCMGRLMDTALFIGADSCGMGVNGLEGELPSCCDDETIVIDGQDDLSSISQGFSFDLPLQPTAVSEFLFTAYPYHSRILPEEHYPPPILIEDIVLLDQVFLI